MQVKKFWRGPEPPWPPKFDPYYVVQDVICSAQFSFVYYLSERISARDQEQKKQGSKKIVEVTYTYRYTSGHLIPNSVYNKHGIKCLLVYLQV